MTHGTIYLDTDSHGIDVIIFNRHKAKNFLKLVALPTKMMEINNRVLWIHSLIHTICYSIHEYGFPLIPFVTFLSANCTNLHAGEMAQTTHKELNFGGSCWSLFIVFLIFLVN